MTNQIALTLALLIVAIFAADALWLHLGLPVILGKAMDGLIEQVSFWR